MKKPFFTFLLGLCLAVSGAFATQRRTMSVTPTSIVTTNAYTALTWNFGSAGRTYRGGDTVTFMGDSAGVGYIQSRDFGPLARNQASANLFLPDSMRFCIEANKLSAADTLHVSFLASFDGGNYWPMPLPITATSQLPTARGMYCSTRQFVPATWLKPQFYIVSSNDSTIVYSAILFSNFFK